MLVVALAPGSARRSRRPSATRARRSGATGLTGRRGEGVERFAEPRTARARAAGARRLRPSTELARIDEPRRRARRARGGPTTTPPSSAFLRAPERVAQLAGARAHRRRPDELDGAAWRGSTAPARRRARPSSASPGSAEPPPMTSGIATSATTSSERDRPQALLDEIVGEPAHGVHGVTSARSGLGVDGRARSRAGKRRRAGRRRRRARSRCPGLAAAPCVAGLSVRPSIVSSRPLTATCVPLTREKRVDPRQQLLQAEVVALELEGERRRLDAAAGGGGGARRGRRVRRDVRRGDRAEVDLRLARGGLELEDERGHVGADRARPCRAARRSRSRGRTWHAPARPSRRARSRRRGAARPAPARSPSSAACSRLGATASSHTAATTATVTAMPSTSRQARVHQPSLPVGREPVPAVEPWPRRARAPAGAGAAAAAATCPVESTVAFGAPGTANAMRDREARVRRAVGRARGVALGVGLLGALQRDLADAVDRAQPRQQAGDLRLAAGAADERDASARARRSSPASARRRSAPETPDMPVSQTSAGSTRLTSRIACAQSKRVVESVVTVLTRLAASFAKATYGGAVLRALLGGRDLRRWRARAWPCARRPACRRSPTASRATTSAPRPASST